MVFGLVLVLIVAVIFMLCMAHSHSLHFGLAGKIITIIALPFVGAIIGLLGDLAVASQSVEWFPVLWMYGGFIGMIASLVVMIITATKASHEKAYHFLLSELFLFICHCVFILPLNHKFLVGQCQ